MRPIALYSVAVSVFPQTTRHPQVEAGRPERRQSQSSHDPGAAGGDAAQKRRLRQIDAGRRSESARGGEAFNHGPGGAAQTWADLLTPEGGDPGTSAALSRSEGSQSSWGRSPGGGRKGNLLGSEVTPASSAEHPAPLLTCWNSSTMADVCVLAHFPFHLDKS